MKAPQRKKGMHWVLMVFAIAAVIVLLTTVLNNTSTEVTDEAMTSAENDRQQESEPAAGEVESIDPAKPLETAIQPTHTAEPLREPPKEHEYISGRPLYFRAVFGQDGTDSMLGVVDELGGTGTGYNVAYVDENRNGDLTDDSPKKFPKYEQGSRAGQTDPRFYFNGQLKEKPIAKYSLDLYTLERGASVSPGDHYFFWTLDTDGWHYFFINGKIRMSSSAADAMAGPPVHLAGQCKWQISAKRKSGKAEVSAGLKDENGCTLRLVRQSGRMLSPRLSLVKDGKVELEEDMKFG